MRISIFCKFKHPRKKVEGKTDTRFGTILGIQESITTTAKSYLTKGLFGLAYLGLSTDISFLRLFERTFENSLRHTI